ncbi:MAG: hypothetical protein M5U14_03770 [Acidimicrobiia bacterium]|nr:hypothetical protein [Acidimicrobiia bacterium]
MTGRAAHAGASRAAARAALVWWLARTTFGVALVELLVLRVFTRTIIHIPGGFQVSWALSGIGEGGRFASSLATVLLTGLLVAVVLTVPVWGAPAPGPGSAARSRCSSLVAAGARAGLLDSWWPALGVAAAVVALAGLARPALDPSGRVVVALFVGGFAAAALHAALRHAAVDGARPPVSTSWLLLAGEALALAAAAASPLLARRRIDRPSLVAGGLAGAGLALLLVAQPATTKILLLWNLGLAGYFSPVVHGLAFGALTATLVALTRSGDGHRALALGFLVLGGIGLHSTYQSGLVVAGLALLTLAAAPGTARLTGAPGTARPAPVRPVPTGS